MSNNVFIATSLDGYIAKNDGNLDWLENIHNPTNSDFGYANFIKGIDAIVMGRGTFMKVLSFESWPYTNQVYVLSNSLNSVPEHLTKKVMILKGDLNIILKKIHNNGHHKLYIDGGYTISEFLKKGLINQLIITRVPVILGKGISLFNDLDSEINLNHVSTRSFENGLVQSTYNFIHG